MFSSGFWFSHSIQIRQDTLTQERPGCPRGCSGKLHRHGSYARYENPSGALKLKVQRFYCRPCKATVSVLPANHLPYRSVKVDRLQADFDQRANIDPHGPDPPPDCVEAGCLKRAWSSLASRLHRLADVFGQRFKPIEDVQALWCSLRQTMNSARSMLGWLAQYHHISLLGDYRCLRPPA